MPLLFLKPDIEDSSFGTKTGMIGGRSVMPASV